MALGKKAKGMWFQTARWSVASLLFLFVLVLPSLYGAETDDPWDFLSEFRHVQGTIRHIDERHVAALFYHAENRLRALVIFLSNCEAQRCSLGQPVAYSVFDAKGLIIRSHEDAGEKFLLQRILISASAMFAAA